jgi:HEAT repeat protein
MSQACFRLTALLVIPCCLLFGQSGQPEKTAASSPSQAKQESKTPTQSEKDKQAEPPQDSSEKDQDQEKEGEQTIPDPALPALQGAWQLLEAGAKSEKPGDRSAAMHALALARNNSRAGKLAQAALKDEKPEVRSAAAEALGGIQYRASIPALEKTLDDSDPTVVLSAAHSLVLMKDDQGYEVYYEILTGERKSGKGLLASPTALLKDKKKLLSLGFHEGLGFVPFGGLSYEAFRMLTKDDVSPLRAAAAKILAGDPDSGSYKALLGAAGDKNWLVRAAAIEGLAQRGNPAALQTVALYMYDERPEVKYAAGAAVVRLSSARKAGVKKEQTN